MDGVAVHVFLSRIFERVILFMATLSFNETPENEEALDDQAHEMMLETLKEEARAKTMANNVEDEEEEIIVSESSLMDLINRLGTLTTDVALVKRKVNNVTKKINFTSRLQAGDIAGAQDSDAFAGGTNAKAKSPPSPLPVSHPSKPTAQLDEGAQSDGAHGHVATGAGEERGGRVDGVGNRTAPKGVSFAIAGAAFGKLPSRPSSTSSSRSAVATPVRASASVSPARFKHIQGLDMQWLPPDCDAWMLAGSGGRQTEWTNGVRDSRPTGNARGWTGGNVDEAETDLEAVRVAGRRACTLQMS